TGLNKDVPVGALGVYRTGASGTPRQTKCGFVGDPVSAHPDPSLAKLVLAPRMTDAETSWIDHREAGAASSNKSCSVAAGASTAAGAMTATRGSGVRRGSLTSQARPSACRMRMPYQFMSIS